MVERGSLDCGQKKSSEIFQAPEGALVGASTFLEGELGVIAMRDFYPRELIFIVSGSIITERTKHSFQVGANKHIDPRNDGRPGLGYYTNHRCNDPSARVEVMHDNANGSIRIIATREIKKGEEVTIDYATIEYETTVSHLPCKCGSPRCRGYIKGYKDLAPEEKAECQGRGVITAYLLELDSGDLGLRR